MNEFANRSLTDIDELVTKYEAGESSTALVADYGIAKATGVAWMASNSPCFALSMAT